MTPWEARIAEDDRQSQIRLAEAFRGKRRHVARNAPRIEIGGRVGRLTLVERHVGGGAANRVRCRCDCGAIVETWMQNVKRLGDRAACNACLGDR